jgi:hypothetical protein
VDAVPAIPQVLAFGGVMGQIDRAVVGGYRFLAASEPIEQVGAGGSCRLETAGGRADVFEQVVERGEAGRGALDLGGDGGEGDAAAERRRHRVQHAVQGQQRRPVRRACPSPGAVHGLDRGLELEAPQLPPRVRRPEVLMRPVDQLRVPQRRVLVGQRDKTTAGVQTRRGARRRELDESGEPVRLRIARYAPGEHLGEVQCLRGQVAGLRSGRRPVDDVRTVDRLKDRGHPRR